MMSPSQARPVFAVACGELDEASQRAGDLTTAWRRVRRSCCSPAARSQDRRQKLVWLLYTSRRWKTDRSLFVTQVYMYMYDASLKSSWIQHSL